jgi:hypothetical protein
VHVFLPGVTEVFEMTNESSRPERKQNDHIVVPPCYTSRNWQQTRVGKLEGNFGQMFGVHYTAEVDNIQTDS